VEERYQKIIFDVVSVPQNNILGIIFVFGNVNYTTKELRIPTKNTSKNQIPIPENTVPLFSAQPSGVAKTTGTPTTKRNDTTINANKAN
jgi:hypothetical protein